MMETLTGYQADYNISTGSTIHMVQRSSADNNSLSSTEAQYSLPAQDCLSRFPVELPVTVLRRQTAMVPVVDVRTQRTQYMWIEL